MTEVPRPKDADATELTLDTSTSDEAAPVAPEDLGNVAGGQPPTTEELTEHPPADLPSPVAEEPDPVPSVPLSSEPEPEQAPEPEPEVEQASEPEPAEPASEVEQASEPKRAEPASEPESAEPASEVEQASEPDPEVGPSEPEPAPSGPAGPASPAAGEGPKPVVGDAGKIVRGVVISIEPDELNLTLDDGRPAVLPRRHWDSQPVEDLTTVVSLNDRIEAAVLARDDPKNRVVLSRAWAVKTRAWEAAQSAQEANAILHCRISSLSPKGAVVSVQGLRGFIPASHLRLDVGDEPVHQVGEVVEARVLEADPKKERLVLSRRSILLRDQRKQAHDVLTRLTVGECVTGRVVSLSDYGAFVDVGGVKGLVHLSELSWHRVGHPRDVVSVGDEVMVKVLDVKVKKRRVSLSLRQTAADPLATVVVGAVVTAPVSRLVDFGAFVDLGGIEGLVHVSELAEYRVSTPEEIVTPGEVVLVKVLSVDRRRRRVELSIRQAVSDHYGS